MEPIMSTAVRRLGTYTEHREIVGTIELVGTSDLVAISHEDGRRRWIPQGQRLTLIVRGSSQLDCERQLEYAVREYESQGLYPAEPPTPTDTQSKTT